MSELSKSLHSMSVGDILDRSIQLYKDNFTKFIGIVLLIKGPYMILAYVLSKLIAFFIARSPYIAQESIANIAPMSAIFIVKFLDLLFIPFVGPIVTAAMTMAISERYMNRDIGITEAYSRILRRFLPLLGTILLSGLVISSGFIFALMVMIVSPPLGGIIFLGAPFLAAMFWVWYAFIPQTVIIEGEGGFGAMKRSKYLVGGYFKKVFALIILVFLVMLLVASLASYGIGKLLFFLGQSGSLLGEGASNVISILLEPFRMAALTLLYYDLRIRKEGFDLEIMAEELETEIGSIE